MYTMMIGGLENARITLVKVSSFIVHVDRFDVLLAVSYVHQVYHSTVLRFPCSLENDENIVYDVTMWCFLYFNYALISLAKTFAIFTFM